MIVAVITLIMNDSQAELVLDWYLNLEGRLFSLLGIVPFSDATSSTFLPSVSSIVLESASLLDTVFRNEHTGSKKRKDLSIVDYATHYEPIYGCSGRHSVLFLHPARYITPFAGWLNSNGKYESMEWWASYNKLKHDRIAHYALSTLGTALNSVCALHQIIALIPSFVSTLFRRNYVNCGSYNPDYIADVMRGNSDPDPGLFAAFETELFCSSSVAQRFPDDMKRLNPWQFPGSRLGRHLSHTETNG